MINYLDSFIESLTEEDFIRAYPGSLEFLLDNEKEKGLIACKQLQKYCVGVNLYVGNPLRFEDKIIELIKKNPYYTKKIAMDLHVSERQLIRIANNTINS